MWKRLLPKEIEDGSHGIMEYILTWCNHSTPSISGEGKSASGHLVDSIKELAFMRIRDNLPKSWPVASPSFTPLHLASAVAISLTWVIAPLCRPPRVSRANGRKTIPSR